MLQRSLLLFVFFVFASNAISAQIREDSVQYHFFEGEIVDDSLGFTIPGVHFWNESSRIGGVSNKNGEFSIKVSENDTLVFSALGYFYKLFVVQGSENETNSVIRLKPLKYEIGEAVVVGYRDYASFKEHFLELDLRDEKTENLKKNINKLGTMIALEADRERAVKSKMAGFGYTSALSGRISAEQAKLREIERLKRRAIVINEKYSRTLVADITKLEGDDLTRFIAHCNFSEDYLYESDLLTIIEAVERSFKSYHFPKDSIPVMN